MYYDWSSTIDWSTDYNAIYPYDSYYLEVDNTSATFRVIFTDGLSTPLEVGLSSLQNYLADGRTEVIDFVYQMTYIYFTDGSTETFDYANGLYYKYWWDNDCSYSIDYMLNATTQVSRNAYCNNGSSIWYPTIDT